MADPQSDAYVQVDRLHSKTYLLLGSREVQVGHIGGRVGIWSEGVWTLWHTMN